MKRKGLIVVLCLMLLFVVAVGASQATFYTCTVNSTGVWSGGVFYINLTDTAASPGWTGGVNFFLPAGTTASASLAAGLTAWSNAGKVVVWLDSTAVWTTIATVACTN